MHTWLEDDAAHAAGHAVYPPVPPYRLLNHPLHGLQVQWVCRSGGHLCRASCARRFCGHPLQPGLVPPRQQQLRAGLGCQQHAEGAADAARGPKQDVDCRWGGGGPGAADGRRRRQQKRLLGRPPITPNAPGANEASLVPVEKARGHNWVATERAIRLIVPLKLRGETLRWRQLPMQCVRAAHIGKRASFGRFPSTAANLALQRPQQGRN